MSFLFWRRFDRKCLYFAESLLLEDVAGCCPVTGGALTGLVCPAEGGSEGERAAHHSVLSGLTADSLHSHELRQTVEGVLGQVSPGALAVLVLILVREGDDEQVGPEHGGSRQTLLASSRPFLFPPLTATITDEEECDDKRGYKNPDQSEAVNGGQDSHYEVQLLLNLL